MAKKPGSRPSAMKTRAAKSAAAMSSTPAAQAAVAPAPAAEAPRRKTNVLQFLREVRAEAKKITWTTRKETWITSVMVFLMVIITSIFFAAVDLGLGFSVNQILKLATAG